MWAEWKFLDNGHKPELILAKGEIEAGSPKPSEDRTFRAVFEMPKVTNHQLLTKICKHQYRNPIYLARQWQKGLSEGKYSSQAELARKKGVSRARVTVLFNRRW